MPKTSDLRAALFFACAIASAAVIPAAVASDSRPSVTTSTAATFEPARTPSGKPDFSGVWQVLNRANYDLEPHAAKAAMAMKEGPMGPIPATRVVALGAVGAVPAGTGVIDGGDIPYTDQARALRDENQANWLARDPEIKCYLPGVPRATYMPFPFQIFHNDGALLFSYEYAGAVRNIALADPGPAPIDSWMGQSWARWEQDTLVVETTGQHERSWLDRAGNHHSPQLKVTERYTQTSPHTIAWEATLEDPEVYTRPWTMRMNLYRRVGEDARIMQFNCVEFVEQLMYGHLRAED